MIQQTVIGLNSRSEADPGYGDSMLPLFTAPMPTVLNSETYQRYEKLGINPILPRGSKIPAEYNGWIALSLEEFQTIYCDGDEDYIQYMADTKSKVLIDVANGNMPKLHSAIRKAKELYGSDITIMAGNVSSLDAFTELASTGVDYIRVGIGGGGACMTTTHTGVGQENLARLVERCVRRRYWFSRGQGDVTYRINNMPRRLTHQEIGNVSRVKIIADGISSYIKSEGLHENGYAAINQLLYTGADYVMIGSIFASAYDSAAPKVRVNKIAKEGQIPVMVAIEDDMISTYRYSFAYDVYATYRGMSTREEQQNYTTTGLKPSEGKTITLKCKYDLEEWVKGCADQRHDEYPGFVNALRSAMAYTGSKTLKEFITW